MNQAFLVSELIDALPDAVFWLEPIRAPNESVTDFQLLFANWKAKAMVQQSLIGSQASPLFVHSPEARQLGLFDRYARVLETGEPSQFEFYYGYNNFDDWFDIHAAKLGDGLLVSVKIISEQKRAAAQLAQQQVLLNSVLDASVNGIIAYRSCRSAEAPSQIIDFEIELYNHVAQRIGNLPTDAAGQTLLTLFPGSLPTGLFDRYVAVVASGEPFSTELHYTADNLNGWFNVTVVKWGDGLVATFTDITAQRLATVEAEEQAALFKAVLEGLQNGLTVLEAISDPDTGELLDFRYIATSHQVTKSTALSQEDMQKSTLLTLFPGVRHSQYWPVYQRVLETGQSERFEAHYQADGYDNYVDNYVGLLGPGRLMTVYYILNEYRQALADLERAQAVIQNEAVLFNTLSRNVPGMGVLVCDSRLRVLFANGDLPDAFAMDPKQAIGKGLEEVLKQEWQQAGRQYFTSALEGSSNTMTELVNNQFYEVYFGPVSNGAEPSTMAMATFRNVTETRQFQQQLETSVRELQRSNANLEQFAYVASHDLQEPLRKVQSFGDVLLNQYAPQLDGAGADLIGRMQSAAARMQGLIQDLLTYSRVTISRESFRPVDVNQVIREVLTDLETVITDKHAIIQLEDSMPHLTGDPLQLRQLFLNLLSNALKFSKADVPPVVRITCHQGPGQTLSWTHANGSMLALADLDRPFYRIDVIDNGIGFEPKYAERIFQVFQRLHGRQRYQGTGIGLAIVQKVVDNHQGYIVAEGKPGEGAVFRVLLPTETV